MNIIIPAAGIGKRFSEDGYDRPKPLINVHGDPLIVHVIRNLKLSPDDNIYIVYNHSLNAFLFMHILSKEFVGININFIPLNFVTRGAAETVLCGINNVSDLDDQVLVLDCDTFYVDDIISLAKSDKHSTVYYFKDYSTDPIFSYINMDVDNRVIDIKEKSKISDNACSGAYGFSSGHVLKKYCEITLDLENKSKGEYYISNMYHQMITAGETVVAKEINDFYCLGTPNQLKMYCLTKDMTSGRKRFCFDLDNTLVTYPDTPGDYSTVKPIWRNIKFVRYLHGLGHTIIIHTARKMRTSAGNVGQATKLAHQDVFSVLELYSVPFDEIYFGKPYADFYIDDLSVRPFVNMEKDLGFYDANIESRHFNNVEYSDGVVSKTTNNPGEIHWYNNIPKGFEQNFPKVYSIDGNTIKMEKVDGIVFSYLLVNNSLTVYNLDLLLDTISDLHKSAQVVNIPDVRANYDIKIAKRYLEFDYSKISDDASVYFNKIINSDRMEPLIGVIHGDLVFSNVFLCDRRNIKLIDMRGKVGSVDTIFGDVFYDYAKIYQSLVGYDFILNDYEINHTYLSGIRSHFEAKFIKKYTHDHLEYLKYITAGLLFSLIPLHTDIVKQKKYYNLIKTII